MTLPPTESTTTSSSSSPLRIPEQQEYLHDDDDAVVDRTRLAIAAAHRALQQRSVQHHQHHSPTRTLRLAAAEQQPHSRESTPVIRRLINNSNSRPRSNNRGRYESPLDPAAFRRESLTSTNTQPDHENHAGEARRITIRSMMTGAAVGTTARTTRQDHHHQHSLQKTKSYKQGPSHRKVRRWNNENFKHLAAEMASLSLSSTAGSAADVLLQGHRDAAKYRYLDPNENSKSERQMQKFMQDNEYQSIRSQFFEGELPSAESSTIARYYMQQQQKQEETQRHYPRTAAEKLNQMDNRLRSVILRACRNSMPTFKLVQQLEQFVVSTFARKADASMAMPEAENDKEDIDDMYWWKHVALEHSPVITRTNEESTSSSSATISRYTTTTVKFVFASSPSSNGGFHRLLLHGICQFHGLKTVSKMIIGQDKQETRALVVSGILEEEEDTCATLTRYLSESEESAG